jgi:hypothetical protein
MLFCLVDEVKSGAPRLRRSGGIGSLVCLYCLLILGVLLFPGQAGASTGLQVGYGASGIQQVSYNGVVLENVALNASDAFHIWHMKATDLKGNTLSGGQYGWGEVNNGKNWNPQTYTWTYQFVWGTIAVQFEQAGDTLNMNVSVTNFGSSGIILDGATIYPFVLNFPALPLGFANASYEQLAFNTTGPSVTLADFGQGEVAAVYPNARKLLYSGFQPASALNSYTPVISGTALDGMATFYPRNDRPVYPGQTDMYTVSLRFAASGTPRSGLAADAYAAWAAAWPPAIHWSDRRIIGTVYLASSPAGNPNTPGGYPNNPRRYFNDTNASDFDIRTATGLANFQTRILQQAQENVQNLARLNAQAAITWDIEGEQYPQTTSYVCEPDLISQAAPEMETIIQNTSSPYHGMKLDDAYFKIIRSAGFRVGVCIRPQHFTMKADGSASQVWLADSEVAAELTRKIAFAHSRWGATIFYVDSSVDSSGQPLDAAIFQSVAAAFPDSLLIPEETGPKHYAYTAPFETFLFHTDLGTPLDIYNYYPKAFSANLVNDVDAGKLAAYLPQLIASVKRGDVLMVHADYWQANNPTVLSIYADAGSGQTPPPPPASVQLTSPMAGQTLSGPVTASAQILGATLDSAGSYLLADGSEVGTARVTSAPYTYSLDTTKLSNGNHSLQIWAQDTSNETLLSNMVAVTISNTNAAPPSTYPISLTFPLAGQSVSGTMTVTAAISQTLDAAGSYLMLDGQEVGTARITNPPYSYPLTTTGLPSGQHTLQIWAHDTNNDTLLSNPVNISVP